MRGSKRVPGLQITKNGAAEIDLWCARGKGHAVVIENQITIVPVSMQDNQCPADRLRVDEDLLNNLTAVTTWRWDGQLLVSGRAGSPLRFPIRIIRTGRNAAVVARRSTRTMSGTKRIALIGAGIGGLTAARALALRGFEVRVFEQSDELKEVGAGIQVAPNSDQGSARARPRAAIESRRLSAAIGRGARLG